MGNDSVSCLYESKDGVILGTVHGSIELYQSDGGNVIQTHDSELVHFWPHSLEFLQVIGSDGSVYNIDKDNPCDSKGFQIGSPISCIAHHPRLPILLAYGNFPDQSIRVCELGAAANTDHPPLHQLQSIKYHDGFLGQRLGFINRIAWHPNRMIMGTITSEVFVSIYGQRLDTLI